MSDPCLNCGRSSSDITTTYKGMVDNAKKIEILENALKFAEKLGNEIIWDNQPVSAITARIQLIRCIEEYECKK